MKEGRLSLFGIEFVNLNDLASLAFHFGLNLMVMLIITRWLYYQGSRRKDYLFTYIIISSVSFLLCYLLENVKLEIGFALGLFAVFGIIRYRTNAIPIKEMTYLFLVIGISVVNALATRKSSITEVVFTNIVVIAMVYCYEKVHFLKHVSSKLIVYEKINLITPDKRDLLISDLKARTGIDNISNIEIGMIDFLKDICHLTIYYEEEGGKINLTDQAERNGKYEP
jgi:hypothetical protein